MVTLSIKNSRSKITGLESQVSSVLYERLSYGDIDAGNFTSLYDAQNKIFPTGLVDEVIATLKEFACDFQIQDLRTKPNYTVDFPFQPKFPLRPEYQVEDLERMLKFARGIVKLPTGGGKTLLAAHYIAARKVAPVIFYVHRLALLENAYDDFVQQFDPEWVGRVGGGYFETDKPIVVAMIQTVAAALKLEESKEKLTTEQAVAICDMVERAQSIIGDEAHHSPAATFYKIILASKNAYLRKGLSATPFRSDGLDIMITSAFGRRIVNRTASELADLGYLVNPTIEFVEVPRLPYNLGMDWHVIYKNGITHNEQRNKIVADETQALYEEGRVTGVFVNHISHGRTLLKLLHDKLPIQEVSFVEGNTPSDLRRKIFEDARVGKARIIVVTSLADEGIDIPRMNGIVLADGGRAPVEKIQQIGRGLRIHPSKTDCKVIDFFDQSSSLERHARDRMELYQTIERNWRTIYRKSRLQNVRTSTKTHHRSEEDW